jgi:hypothetical protein
LHTAGGGLVRGLFSLSIRGSCNSPLGSSNSIPMFYWDESPTSLSVSSLTLLGMGKDLVTAQQS